MAEDFVIEMLHITKEFPGIKANDDITLQLRKGEVHALLGENGAGKSTLMSVLFGLYQPEAGQIRKNGKEVAIRNPNDANALGIGMVHQHFKLVDIFSAADNIWLGDEKSGPILKKDRYAVIQEMARKFGFDIDPRKKVYNMAVSEKQTLEIIKVLCYGAKVIILDEPTAPLTNAEIDILFRVLAKLKADGISMIYISHRLEEVFRMCDKITVLRDGQFIRTMDVADTSKEELIHLMIGRELSQEFPPRPGRFDYAGANTVLKVEHLTNRKLKDVSFELKGGEILGIAGLVGAGRTETVRAIFGADKLDKGSISIRGRPVAIKNPSQAIKNGIGLIPEDRKREGLMLILPISINMSIVVIQRLCRGLMISSRKEKELLQSKVKLLSVKLPSLDKPVSSLSGGNQQKIVLAKWLSTNADILIFDEPTRGIDVGAKREIYDFLFDLKSKGKSMIVISSEMSEILNLSDRILVMHEGALKGELFYQDATQDKILSLASGLA